MYCTQSRHTHQAPLPKSIHTLWSSPLQYGVMAQVGTVVSIFTEGVNNTDSECSSRLAKNHHDPTELCLPWKTWILFSNQDSSESLLKKTPPCHHAQAVTASAVFPDLTCYASCTSRNVAIFNVVTPQCTIARFQKIHVQCSQFKLEPNNRLYTRTARHYCMTAQWPKMPPVFQRSVLLSHVTKCFCIIKCTSWCSTISLHESECSPQASYTTDMHYHITRPMYHRLRPKRPPARHCYVSSPVHSPLATSRWNKLHIYNMKQMVI